MGLTVVDAGVVIAALSPQDTHHGAAVAAISTAIRRGDRLAIPASALAEALVHPFRSGQAVVDQVERFIDELPATVEPLTRRMAHAAAAARASNGRNLALPDALIVATAIVLDADDILTTDLGWPSVGRQVTVVGG
ncbi:MAG: type II toxin-antitoxin system VapC family toxin [Chloroflexi bacterium]|nr:type II toxin-antitoxin system VapC family toxin [Chloroflexota bacterium]